MLTIRIFIGLIFVMPVVAACMFHAMLRIGLAMKKRGRV